MTTRELEAAVVFHHVIDRKRLAGWPTLILSPECAACLDAIYAHPDRPASVALALAYLIGDVELDAEIHAAAADLAAQADAMTLRDAVTLGSLTTIVHTLHAQRLQLGRAA